MGRELLTQRIKYLIEQGGVLDDPLADLRRELRVPVWVIAGAAVTCAGLLAYIAVCCHH